MSVGRHVQAAIDYMDGGEIALALTDACIALDITSQRYSSADHSGKVHFKKFVQDHLWLITYMGFPKLMTTEIRLPLKHQDVVPDAAGNVEIEDIIYHVIWPAVDSALAAAAGSGSAAR